MRAVRCFSCLCLLFALTCLAAPPIAAQQAQQVSPYDAFYAFGDSLVDNGNDFIVTQAFGFNPAIPPSISPHKAYYQRRFSNGPVAFEYLWQLLSGNAPGSRDGLTPLLQFPLVARSKAINFAFGGSGTGVFDPTPGGFSIPGLKGQVELFRATVARRARSARALYAVLAGAGDYLRPVPLTPAESVGNITDAVRRLYDLGARDVIVLNLPDLGLIPMVADTPERSALLSQLSQVHNATLALSLDALQASLPDLNLIAIDVNAVLKQVPPTVNVTLPAMDALLPAAPGEPPASTCLFINPATCRDVPTFDVDLQYLFWDGEHPTTAVHRLLAEYVYSTLAQSALQTSR
jgi:phospholipase/lecithinase/hemolysin